MELNVGDYVRTKKRGFQKPQIAKIINISKDEGYKNQNYITLDHNLIPDYEFHIYEADIAKSSPNIIDLIEVGDYVNGHRVVEKLWLSDTDDEYDEYRGAWCVFCESRSTGYEENEIKSIVTKEMYSSVEYRVESH